MNIKTIWDNKASIIKGAKNNIMRTKAIEELEQLKNRILQLEEIETDLIMKKNRSCENCKFKYVVDSMCTECRCNESPIDYIDFDCFPFFCCNKWKSKNENL